MGGGGWRGGGGRTRVEDTVDEGEVDGDEEEDRLDEEHLDGSVERAVEHTLDGPVCSLVFCVDLCVLDRIRFPEALSLPHRKSIDGLALLTRERTFFWSNTGA